MAKHVFSGEGEPVKTPEHLADHYVDTVAGAGYLSTDTEDVGGWKKLFLHPSSAGGFRVHSEQLQVKNVTSGLWHTLYVIDNADGDAVLTIEGSGEA